MRLRTDPQQLTARVFVTLAALAIYNAGRTAGRNEAVQTLAAVRRIGA